MPGVGDLLIPGRRIHPAAIVVVSQDAEPGDVELGGVVDLVVDGVEPRIFMHFRGVLWMFQRGRRPNLSGIWPVM